MDNHRVDNVLRKYLKTFNKVGSNGKILPVRENDQFAINLLYKFSKMSNPPRMRFVYSFHKKDGKKLKNIINRKFTLPSPKFTNTSKPLKRVKE